VGLTILDAGIVIAVLDANDVHHLVARAVLRDALERGDRLALPVSAYVEVMVGPHRSGPDEVATVDTFLDALPATVEPASRDIARVAAALRALCGGSLRLPDALVLATADVLEADTVLTTDAGWPDTGVDVHVVGSRSGKH
jgi:predicted nucleic acid-binding protein